MEPRIDFLQRHMREVQQIMLAAEESQSWIAAQKYRTDLMRMHAECLLLVEAAEAAADASTAAGATSDELIAVLVDLIPELPADALDELERALAEARPRLRVVSP